MRSQNPALGPAWKTKPSSPRSKEKNPAGRRASGREPARPGSRPQPTIFGLRQKIESKTPPPLCAQLSEPAFGSGVAVAARAPSTGPGGRRVAPGLRLWGAEPGPPPSTQGAARREGRWRPPSNCATSPGHRPGPAPS